MILSLVLAVASSIYAARHFAINTDINTLISPELDWRKRDVQFEEAFDREKLILAVVEAPTPELAATAANALDAIWIGPPRPQSAAEGHETDIRSVEGTPLDSGAFSASSPDA